MSDKKILITGLYHTGKTTFIAALWYLLYEHNDETCLKLGPLSDGEHEYLNMICNCWMKFEPVPRTSQNMEGGQQIEIIVQKVATGETISLEIPDFSGETFKSHYDDRIWTEEFKNTVDNTSGILLFVNPKQDNNLPKLVVKELELMRIFGNQEPNNNIEFTQYDAKYTPNQVKIVEELQFLELYGKIEFPIRLGIVVSLWDEVEKIYGDTFLPESWLENNMPLLHQYLCCNKHLFNIKFFGISAQGGDYLNRDIIADKEMHKRVYVKEGNEKHNDITRPIHWVSE